MCGGACRLDRRGHKRGGIEHRRIAEKVGGRLVRQGVGSKDTAHLFEGGDIDEGGGTVVYCRPGWWWDGVLAKGRDCLPLHMRTVVFRTKLLLGKRAGLLFGRSGLAHAHNYLRRWVVY